MAEEQQKGQNLLWPIVAVLLLLAIVFAFAMKGGLSIGGVSKGVAIKDAMKYVNENFRTPESPEYFYDEKTISESHGLYTVKIKTKDDKGTEIEVGVLSVTKDGQAIFPGELIEIKKKENTKEGNTAATKEVKKSDKPEVKLFVMSFCPFGLQAEKAILPAMQLLKDKADIGIYYVNYIMHGKKEADQNIRQYCIGKEQNDKFNAYLTCFATYDVSACQKAAAALKDAAAAQAAAEACYNPAHSTCASKAGIDTAKLESCYSKTFAELKLSANAKDYEYSQEKGFPAFALHDELNKQFSVQGSPTMVINGVEVQNVTRSPEGFKTAICNAFNNKPSECEQKLSESAASAGMGPSTGAAASSNASCN